MPRIRQDNDARYALRASFVDENGDVIQGDKLVIQPGPPGPPGPEGPQGPAGSDATNYWSLNGGDVYRSSGKVGINTNDPQKAIHINSASTWASALLTGVGGGALEIKHYDNTDTNGAIIDAGGALRMFTGGSESMRIDSSGNVIIGDDSPTFNNDAKTVIRATDNYYIKPTVCASFNRTGSDGDILQFYKATSFAGSIASDSGARLKVNSGAVAGYLAVGGTNYYAWNSTDFRGQIDGTLNLGASNARFKDLYLSGDIQHKDNAGNARVLYDRSADTLGNQGTNGSFNSVNIGTDSPIFTGLDRTTLTINGTASANISFGEGGTGKSYILQDAGGLTIGNQSDTLPTIFANQGDTSMVISSNGNVGIGTDSPWSDAQLTVDNGGSGNASIALSRSAEGQNDVALVNDGGQFIVKSGFASTVAGLTDQMRISDVGNVYLGTTNNWFTAAGRKILRVHGAAGGSFLVLDTSGSGDFYIGAENDGRVNFWNQANGPLVFATNNTSRMHISPSGNIGIGDDNPPEGTKVAIQHDGTAIRIDGTAATTKRIFFRNTNAANPAEIVADGSLVLITEDSGMHMEFKTANTERMRIDSSGNLLVNRTSQIHGGKISVDYQNGVNAGIALKDTQTTGTGVPVQIVNGAGSVVGSITHDQSNTSFNPSSDSRLKENIRDYDNALADVMKLKPRKYSWKATGAEDNGFIAQELLETPEFANRVNPLSVSADPMYGVDYMKFVAVLTGAIQEQQAMIEELKAEVAELKTGQMS